MSRIFRFLRSAVPAGVRKKVPVSFKKVALYVLRFGPLKALPTMRKLSASKSGLLAINIPQSRTAIFIRGGTSDRRAFEEVFVDEDYDLPVKIAPKLIIDGGANAGYTSVYFANKYPDAEIIAVEPEESNFEILKKNTAEYSRIKALQAGIWQESVLLTIKNPKDEKWRFRVEEAQPAQGSIRAITIDDILSNAKMSQIDILKLDIEGSERDVLAKSESWLPKVRIMVIELHDRYQPGCTAALYSAISDFKFREFRRGTNIILVRQ